MVGTLEKRYTITEQQFEDVIRDAGLTNEEREALRRQYGIPCNEVLLSRFTLWENLAIVAWRKIAKINPSLYNHLSVCR